MLLCRALCTLLVASLTACASTPSTPPAAPPPDFTLGITVVVRENAKVDKDPRTIARPYRPGRYILEPDGQLRVAIGTGARPATYPPAMRRLTAAQRDEIWNLALKAGYLGIPREDSIDPEVAPVVVSRPTALVYIVADAARRGTQVTLDAPNAEPTRVLIDRLAELAWVEK